MDIRIEQMVSKEKSFEVGYVSAYIYYLMKKNEATKEEAEEVISIPTTKIKIKILDTTNVKEKQIRVSLYKRATKEPADQTYELVDLKDFVKGNLNSIEDKIYSLDNYSTILEFDNKKFENNGYELRFELYDGTRKITSIKKKFIVK